MKFFKTIFFGILLLTFMLTFVDAQNFKVSQMGLGLREYLPGDIVHIVIEAPPDTNRVKATMPNGEEVNLTYDGHSNVWNGYWEVPGGVKKGIYTAKLLASDVEGVTFQGDRPDFGRIDPSRPGTSQ